MFACPKRRFSGNCLSKRQAGRIMVKSIDIGVHEIGIVEEYWSSLYEFNNVYLDGLPHPSWSTATVAGAIVYSLDSKERVSLKK